MASRYGKEIDEVKSRDGHEAESSGDYNSRRSSPSDEPKSGRKDNRDRRRSSRSRSPNATTRRRRSSSRERRRSRSRDRDRRRNEGFKHSRRHSPERAARDEDRRHKHAHYRRHRSRSASTERLEKDRERNKLEMRQQMARNYEEQIEKLKANPGQPMINRYPNQAHVEPAKLVEQIEKRKFLFKKDKPAETASSSSSTTTLWKNTAFHDDSDGKMSAKFKRLMGMKSNDVQPSASTSDPDDDTLKKHDEYFANLEKQYEVARATTHTQRGLGLGFTSRGAFPVHPK